MNSLQWDAISTLCSRAQYCSQSAIACVKRAVQKISQADVSHRAPLYRKLVGMASKEEVPSLYAEITKEVSDTGRLKHNRLRRKLAALAERMISHVHFFLLALDCDLITFCSWKSSNFVAHCTRAIHRFAFTLRNSQAGEHGEIRSHISHLSLLSVAVSFECR